MFTRIYVVFVILHFEMNYQIERHTHSFLEHLKHVIVNYHINDPQEWCQVGQNHFNPCTGCTGSNIVHLYICPLTFMITIKALAAVRNNMQHLLTCIKSHSCNE